jgi:predicted DCC family thiol-disulfide oxidoreductase YuxK
MHIVSDAPPESGTDRPPEIVFFDGNCGLCHRAVRFLLSADREGRAFVFAPLFGETFAQEVPETERASIPDSLVLKTREGRFFVRSDAVLYAMNRLGGVYRWLSVLGRVVPRAVRDFFYDGVAKLRHKLFARPESVCPLVPRELRSRFLP